MKYNFFGEIMKNKKLLWIILLVIIVIIVIIFLAFNKKKVTGEKEIEPSSYIEIINDQKLIEEKIFFPVISIDEKQIIGLTDKGTIFSRFLLAQKTREKLTDELVLGPIKITYSPDLQKAAVFSYYPENNLKIYDFKSKNITSYNKNINNIVWSQKNPTKIYYSYWDVEKFTSQFNQSEDLGKNWNNIYQSEGLMGIQIDKSEKNALIYFFNPFIETKEGDKTLSAKIVDLDNKSVQEIDKNIFIKYAQWSPDGKRIAYLDTESKLNIYDKEAKKIIDLAISSQDNLIVWIDNNRILLARISNQYDPQAVLTEYSLYTYDIKDNIYQEIKLDHIINNATFLQIIGKNVYYDSDNYFYKAELKNL